MSGNGKKDDKRDLFAPISDAIQKVIDELGDDLFLEFACSFMVFDIKKLDAKADDVIHDDRIYAYGAKDSLVIGLKSMIEEMGKDDDFINW